MNSDRSRSISAGRLASITILSVAAAACAIALYATLYPGYVYSDAFDQYQQAMSGVFNDWHPPIIAVIWRQLILLTGNFASITVLNILLLCVSLYLLTRNLDKRVAPFALIGLCFSPLFFVYVAVIWKDVELALICLLVASMLIDRSLRGQPFGPLGKFLLVGLLLIGTFVRANAPFLTSLLIVAVCFGWRPLSWRIFAAGAVCLALIGSTGFVNHTLLGASRALPIRSLQVFDLGGISYFSGDLQFSSVFPQDEMKLLKDGCYTPLHWDSYAWGKCHFAYNGLMEEPLTAEWLAAIKKHPLAYLRHRLAHFNTFLRFIGSYKAYAYFMEAPPGLQGTKVSGEHRFANWYNRTMGRNPYQPWHMPFVWYAIAIALMIATLRSETNIQKTINALNVAAVLYLTAYLVVGVASDFRYALPAAYLIVASLLGWACSRERLGSRVLSAVGLVIGSSIILIGVFL